MFGYASTLVELGYFEAIDINFLIVGHTHSSIDQYFSVLSKAIAKSEFIGSPLSIQALCSQAHKDRARPAVIRQIEACYNIVDALKPYINKKIKFFQVPHCFSFRRRGNKCIMFYKLFSSHPTWLPVEPDLSANIHGVSKSSSKVSEEEKVLCAVSSPSNQIAEVEIQPLANFGGKEAFLSHIGISGENKSTYLINNKAARNKVDAIDSVLPLIMDGEVVALHNLETRTMMEESEGHVVEHKDLIKIDLSQPERLLIQNAMKSVSTSVSKKGYIMWIIDSPHLPPLNSIIPKFIHAGASLRLSTVQEANFQLLKREQNQSSDAIIPDEIQTGLIEVPDNDDDDNNAPLVMEENLFERTNKSFQQRARDIVSVAKKALDHINQTKNGINLDYTYFPDKLYFDGKSNIIL